MLYRYLFTFLITVMSISLVGCNNKTIIEGNNQVYDEETPKEEIMIWHTYSDEETKVFENVLIPLFEKEYPMIDVVPVRQSYNAQLKSAIIARASTNNPPDIIRMDIAWVPFFAQLDLLYPVSDFKDFEKKKAIFYDEPMKSNLYNGEYYGIPLNTNTKVAIYNKKLLEEVGLTKPPKTMDELVSVIEKNEYTIGITGFTIWETLHYFYGLGGTLLDPSLTKATGYFNSNESINAVKKLLEFYKDGKLSPNIFEEEPDTWGGVLSGNYFMIDEGPWFYSIYSEDDIAYINNKTISSPFPINNGEGALMGGENLVITKGTKHLEAAWTFVKWMTDETPQTELAKTGLIPSNKNVELSRFYKQYPYYQTYLEGLNEAIQIMPIGQWSKIDEIYTKYFKMIFSGSISVEDGLNEAAKQMDQILQIEKGRYK